MSAGRSPPRVAGTVQDNRNGPSSLATHRRAHTLFQERPRHRPLPRRRRQVGRELLQGVDDRAGRRGFAGAGEDAAVVAGAVDDTAAGQDHADVGFRQTGRGSAEDVVRPEQTVAADDPPHLAAEGAGEFVEGTAERIGRGGVAAVADERAAAVEESLEPVDDAVGRGELAVAGGVEDGRIGETVSHLDRTEVAGAVGAVEADRPRQERGNADVRLAGVRQTDLGDRDLAAGMTSSRQAVADVELAGADITVAARDVIDRVKRAYAELFLSRKAIDVNHDSLDLLRQFADITSVKYTTGRTSQQETMKAVLEISRLHDDLVMLQQRAALAGAQLNTLLDRRPEAPIGSLAEPRERVLLPAPAALQELALGQQPELRAARIAVERAGAALAVANRDYKPDFFVAGGYMLMPRDTDAWTATVGLTWPSAPWARGRLDARKAEAALDAEAARARQRAVANGIRRAVQDAYIRVKGAEQRASLIRTTILPQARQTLEVARVGYQADRVDFLALLDDQRALLEAQLDYDRALSDLEQALADLERAIGADLTPQMLGAIDVRGGGQ